MADETMNRNIATALLAGAFLGASVALLFAPQSGRKTRRDLCKFAERTGNRVEEVQLELQQSIDDILREIEEKLQEGLAAGMDWTDGKIVDLRRTLKAARKSLAEEIAKIQPA
jgi:gas vesicle protein